MKEIDSEKRICDFDGTVPTRWKQMKETNSHFSSLSTQFLLEKWFNPGVFDNISKLGKDKREVLILTENCKSLILYEGNKFHHRTKNKLGFGGHEYVEMLLMLSHMNPLS